MPTTYQPRRYTNRELERFISQAIGQFTPDALIQLLGMDIGINRPRFRELVWRILNRYCSRFLRRAKKWTPHPELDPLKTMANYHNLWEGFHCDEPYFNSEAQPIKYFMNAYTSRRLEEADAMFITGE